MNNPIPLDLVTDVRKSYLAAPSRDVGESMQAALAAHLPEIAALPAVRDLVLADRREADVEVIVAAIERFHWLGEGSYDDALAKHIAAALSDATNGGHWEEGEEAYERALKAGLPRRAEYRGPANCHGALYGWVPADPDARLLAIVDADTLARLREVAEVTAR